LSGKFEKYASTAHEAMLQVNIMCLTQLCALFIPMLKQQQQAYIMNIASSAAYQAVPYLGAYAASKSYVLSFSRALYQEYINTSLSVTCICPGPTDTDFPNRAFLGPKGMKTAAKLNMTPEKVAEIAVKSMFAKKPNVILGFVNKLGAFLAWLLPNHLVERSAMSIYQ
jgi:short-subunit dehydrogenase